ncbi:MAG: VWA domain-containing protein [Planctomycetes bacterium]|nr:VWA domain-containing protein [Planctomycetota bacterium]
MQSAAGARQESGEPPVRTPRLLRAILLGVAFSVPFHLLLVGVLALIPMLRPVATEPVFEVFDVVLAAPTPLERPAEPSTELADDLPALESPGTADPASAEAMPLPRQGSPVPIESGFGAGAGMGVGDGGGDGFGGGSGGGTTFFGVQGTGRRVAFIVDKSGSMSRGSRMDRARAEVTAAVWGLPDYAKVCVLFYDTTVVSPPGFDAFTRLRGASRDDFVAFLAGMRPSGDTSPIGAFRRAFGQGERPDLVYFLSDGEINPEEVDAILALNASGRPAVIHCIALGSDAGKVQLQRVAAVSGGSFTFVPEYPQ